MGMRNVGTALALYVNVNERDVLKLFGWTYL